MHLGNVNFSTRLDNEQCVWNRDCCLLQLMTKLLKKKEKTIACFKISANVTKSWSKCVGVCVRWKATVNCVVIEVLYNNTRIDAVKSISFNECTDEN